MVIDTSILIDHLRKLNRTNTNFSQIPPSTPIFVSAITVYELLAGASDLQKLRDAQILLSATTILPFDEDIATIAAQLYQQMKGKTIGLADTFIAATALHHRLPLKTLNISHFSRVEGLILV